MMAAATAPPPSASWKAVLFTALPAGLAYLDSAVKSFIATLVGIALDQGLLDGADHRIVDLFADRLPLKIFLSHGTYDPGASSLRLRDILEAKDYPLRYVETHEGHSYGSVRGVLDDMLSYFFLVNS